METLGVYEKGFHFNLRCRTPLHWAAATGQSQAVSTLLELNANPAPVDVEGATPLEYAHQANHRGNTLFLSIATFDGNTDTLYSYFEQFKLCVRRKYFSN